MQLQREQEAHDATRQELAQTQEAYDTIRQELAASEDAHDTTRQELAANQEALAASQEALVASQEAHHATRQELAAGRKKFSTAETTLRQVGKCFPVEKLAGTRQKRVHCALIMPVFRSEATPTTSLNSILSFSNPICLSIH